MGEQRTFAGEAWARKKKVTRREQVLAEMNAVIPWATLTALIAPHYPTGGKRGRPPMPLERMLRIYFLQQWFNLSDPAAEDALYDSETMRRFVGVDLGEDAFADETTILHFRHLLERHQLTEAIFAAVHDLLGTRGIVLKAGTIVDATMIHAPSSTKNATKTRDPEMKQAQKGKTWYFGMKVHVGTDRQGLVHALHVTDAAQMDVSQLPHLLHGEERALYGDRAYWSERDRQLCEAAGIRYRVNRRGTPHHPIPERWRQINRARSRVRARGEHAFHVAKTLWGFMKVRYRGLAKNTVRAFAAFALANLYLMRYRLGARAATCLS
ncbi:MAG TPA: IS5 family transposase [Gemmatimonadaceae bacterium]|nr:IS5 family transposase [Gemmatimonadaceae bacterium]